MAFIIAIAIMACFVTRIMVYHLDYFIVVVFITIVVMVRLQHLVSFKVVINSYCLDFQHYLMKLFFSISFISLISLMTFLHHHLPRLLHLNLHQQEYHRHLRYLPPLHLNFQLLSFIVTFMVVVITIVCFVIVITIAFVVIMAIIEQALLLINPFITIVIIVVVFVLLKLYLYQLMECLLIHLRLLLPHPHLHRNLHHPRRPHLHLSLLQLDLLHFSKHFA
jgi:hypothetical protein